MLYNIFHSYDVDGGFGDAISQEELLFTVDCTEDEVKDFIKKHSHSIVYDNPYSWLEFGNLYYEQAPVPRSIADISEDELTDAVVGGKSIFLSYGSLPNNVVRLDNEQTKLLWSGKKTYPEYDAWLVNN